MCCLKRSRTVVSVLFPMGRLVSLVVTQDFFLLPRVSVDGAVGDTACKEVSDSGTPGKGRGGLQ